MLGGNIQHSVGVFSTFIAPKFSLEKSGKSQGISKFSLENSNTARFREKKIKIKVNLLIL